VDNRNPIGFALLIGATMKQLYLLQVEVQNCWLPVMVECEPIPSLYVVWDRSPEEFSELIDEYKRHHLPDKNHDKQFRWIPCGTI
jgi:hypothetical protein